MGRRGKRKERREKERWAGGSLGRVSCWLRAGKSWAKEGQRERGREEGFGFLFFFKLLFKLLKFILFSNFANFTQT
jgi:hypothetical protein